MTDRSEIAAMTRPKGLPFRIGKIGHVALHVADLARSAHFYTQILGFQVSDVYDDRLMAGGAVFLRCNPDHHGIALFPVDKEQGAGLHHMAFEVGTLGEVLRARDHLRRHDVPITFEGRRRAGCQIAVEFRDPDGHWLEIYWNVDQVGSDGKVRPPEEWKGVAGIENAIADPVRGQDTSLPA